MNKSTIKRKKRFAQVEVWENSGLSKKAYCKQIGVREDSFSYWYKQYLKEGLELSQKSSNLSEGFIRLPQLESQADLSHEVSFPNGIVLRINSELSLSLLKMLKDV